MSKPLRLALGLIILSLSFFGGYKYGRNNSPNHMDFVFANKFDELVTEELRKAEQSFSCGMAIDASLNGPVVIYSRGSKEIAVILIEDKIIQKVLSDDKDGLFRENWEKVRPLAQSIAAKILAENLIGE